MSRSSDGCGSAVPLSQSFCCEWLVMYRGFGAGMMEVGGNDPGQEKSRAFTADLAAANSEVERQSQTVRSAGQRHLDAIHAQLVRIA